MVAQICKNKNFWSKVWHTKFSGKKRKIFYEGKSSTKFRIWKKEKNWKISENSVLTFFLSFSLHSGVWIFLIYLFSVNFKREKIVSRSFFFKWLFFRRFWIFHFSFDEKLFLAWFVIFFIFSIVCIFFQRENFCLWMKK